MMIVLQVNNMMFFSFLKNIAKAKLAVYPYEIKIQVVWYTLTKLIYRFS